MMRIVWILLCFIFLLNDQSAEAEEQTNYQYELSIVSFFRDEARFLKEWIEYHRMLGVEHFYLYNHLSQDDYLSVLLPYIEEGIVELSNVEIEPATNKAWHGIQNHAYNETIEKARNVTRWLAIIDSDEFLVPVQDKNLIDFLKGYESYGGVLVNWQMYGTSNVWEVPSDGLMIDMLMKRAHANYKYHYTVKSIVQPHRTVRVDSAHVCKYMPPYFAVNSNLEPSSKIYTGWNQVKKVVIDKIRINHYWTRDEKFVLDVKTARADTKEKRERLSQGKEMNSVTDRVMDKFVSALHKRMK